MSISPTILCRTLLLCSFWSMAVCGCDAQSFTNPGFESGTSGWSGCPLEINSASVYGGTGSNKVAEVDGHTNPASTADDRVLCQTISGFTVGAMYALEFDATRRPNASTPSTVSVTVSVSGVLSTVVTRTGGWNMVRERLLFTPTSTSHELLITPNFTVSYGMLFDNFNLYVASPLPVELVHFDAWPTNDAVELHWTTATELNNAAFVVERSTDLEVWTPIQEVEGAGTSQVPLEYRTTDPEPVVGTSFYRLKQVDLDGSVDLSAVRPVRFEGSELLAWPNPAKDRIRVRTKDPSIAVVLYNALGCSLPVHQERSGDVVVLHVSGLPSGTYHIRGLGPDGGTTRFIKE